VGDKLFAVPVEAFRLRSKAGERDRLTLAVDEATLKNAPGFDQDNWPRFSDQAWREKVKKHYGDLKGNRPLREGADIEVRAGDTDISVDVENNRSRQRNANSAADPEVHQERAETIRRTSEIIGMAVMNEDNDELGAVDDIVIDLDRGTVNYLAISYGGVLGLGDKLLAVPLDAVDWRRPAGEESAFSLVWNIEPQMLKDAPGFDQDDWPATADPYWGGESRRLDRAQRQEAASDRVERK
jgi:sporulation protein YlmC with PRC-barrel domain